MNHPAIDTNDRERYAAHLALCEIDLPGQQRLSRARVLVVGAGALASPVLLYLAAAGVGHLGIADGDTVSLSNLQRQILYVTADIHNPKAATAAARLHALNPSVDVTTHECHVTEQNAIDLCSRYDLIVDCTDNYATRALLARTAIDLAKPLCFAAVSRFQAQIFTYTPGSASYFDFFPTPPTNSQLECTSCAVNGVLNAVAGMAGSIQATEAIKQIVGMGTPLTNRMLLIDAIDFSSHIVKI